MTGWIKIHRDIRNHWIWKDEQKLKWWIDILMEANHEEKKVNLGMELFLCKRGQTINSLTTWSKRWNISRDTVRNFLELLKKDGMINTKNLMVSTQITVCNYEQYQSDLHAKQTQSKRKANAKQTQDDINKNEKNNKNNKKILHGVCKKHFNDYYLETKNIEYYWSAKDGFNLNQLLTKIKKFTGDDEQKIEDGFLAYLGIEKDNWINENLSIAILNSKFNEIVAKNKTKDSLKELKDEVGY